MKKRGQVTIFIIIGILIVAFTGFIIFVFSNATEKKEIFDNELDSKIDQMNNLVGGCLEKTVLEGLFIYGVDENSIESYIDLMLGDCIDFSVKFPLLEIVEGDVESEVVLSSDTDYLFVKVDYPLVLKKGDTKSEISKFNLEYPLLIDAKIPLDSNGKTTSKKIVRSADERLVLEIASGTEIKDSNGNPLEDFSIKIEQIDIAQTNWFVYVDYKFEPEIVTFNPPIKITIQYLEDEILQKFGRDESSFKITCSDGTPIQDNQINTLTNILSGSMDKFC